MESRIKRRSGPDMGSRGSGPTDSRLGRHRSHLLWLSPALCLGLLGAPEVALARPTAPAILCAQYPEIPDCSGMYINCSACHTSVGPVGWNAFGLDVMSVLPRQAAFEAELPAALDAIAAHDADEDGVTNADELALGTDPADPASTVPDGGFDDPDPYDMERAFRRVNVLYCGRSPSYDEMTAFRATAEDATAGQERLHSRLDECLATDYWQKTAIPRLADKRIKPQASLGPDTNVVVYSLRAVLGDYHYDYRLWQYIMTNGHDMRDLLTADYHIVEAEDGRLTQTREVLPKPVQTDLGGGQPLVPERRAGMITTQWFIHSNTMVTALPRTAAAQAYRAYLGAEISTMEGIVPMPAEPDDIDEKGVDRPTCANCHSTLDPLAYAFAKYEAAPQGAAVEGSDDHVPTPEEEAAIRMELGRRLNNIGNYNEERPVERIPGWDDAEQQPAIFGQPVDSLMEWVQVAVASDQFKRNLADIFFAHALGRSAGPAQYDEFMQLWASLPEDGFSADKLIHRLIDTHAFGAP